MDGLPHQHRSEDIVKVEDIEGIGPAYAAQLQGAGVATSEALLERAGPKAGRDTLAASTGISGKLLLEWANACDLMRIKGIGQQFSDLLEAAGVDSAAELAQRNPATLANTFAELNAARATTRRAPTEAMVSEWIVQAKQLPKVVTH
jgi:predicted flap endonuclease-1-like 5' DNA nuclease